jgi:hypothetical protein
MKTFKGDFYKLLDKLKNNEHFSYSKYSDGELFILQGKQLILDPNHHSYFNTEDHKYFDPTQHDYFRKMLLDAFRFNHENYYIGICGPSDQSDDVFYWMKNESGRDEQHLTWANLFVNSNYKRFREEFLPEFSNKNIIIVCNEKSDLSKLPFKVKKDFRVGSNCIINNLSLVDEISKYVKDNNITDHLFLFAASSLGNVIIHKLTELEYRNTYFDVGSTLNPLLGLSIDRGYLCAYEGLLWRGQDTSNDLVREETWKL